MLNRWLFCCIMFFRKILLERIMDKCFEVWLNNRDKRLIQLQTYFTNDGKLSLRHSNDQLQISNNYNYTIDKDVAIELARSILQHYGIEK